MDERRKTVRLSNSRQHQIQQALQNRKEKPRMTRWGLTAQQIRDAFNKEQRVERIKKKRTPISQNQGKNQRPAKATRNAKKNWDKKLLLETPALSVLSASQYPTPSWFNFTEKADVSVIVPLYKSASVLKDLIHQWDLYNSGLKVETIYVDDNCPINSKSHVIKHWQEMRSKYGGPVGKIFHSATNQGFGGTCNVGAYHATGDYLIFLNADTIVTKDWIRPIVRLLKKPEVGIVGNLQLKSGGQWNGYIDGAGSEWHWDDMMFHHIGRHCYNLKKLPTPLHPANCPTDVLQEAREVEMVTGCCLAARKEVFEQVGGFDPNYRIGYWEDSEICLSVRELGYKIMFTPHSVIYHKLSHSGSGGHKFQSHNRSYFLNKWVHSGRIDPLVQAKRSDKPKVRSILLKRETAHGDVLMATAVAGALKKKHSDCKVHFNTGHPELLKNNPNIDDFIEDIELSERKFDIYYNLDMAYEMRPKVNVLDAYCHVVGVKREDCDFFIKTTEVENLLPEFIAIHAGYKTQWAGREWPSMKFDILAKNLMEQGHNVVCVGGPQDHKATCHLDLRGKTDTYQLAYVMQQAKLFVGVDSFPFHVAQFCNTPGVCFFGSIDPKTRIYRDNMKPVTAEGLPCLGCHHRKPTPCTLTSVCETKHSDCINNVSVEQMMSAINDSLKTIEKETKNG